LERPFLQRHPLRPAEGVIHLADSLEHLSFEFLDPRRRAPSGGDLPGLEHGEALEDLLVLGPTDREEEAGVTVFVRYDDLGQGDELTILRDGRETGHIVRLRRRALTLVPDGGSLGWGAWLAWA
jgi:hypothetical protein